MEKLHVLLTLMVNLLLRLQIIKEFILKMQITRLKKILKTEVDYLLQVQSYIVIHFVGGHRHL